MKTGEHLLITLAMFAALMAIYALGAILRGIGRMLT